MVVFPVSYSLRDGRSLDLTEHWSLTIHFTGTNFILWMQMIFPTLTSVIKKCDLSYMLTALDCSL